MGLGGSAARRGRRRRGLAVVQRVGSVLLLVFVLAPALLSGSLPAAAGQFSSLFVFGDSGVDAGNEFALSGGTFPASPPAFQGRNSNGPTYAELLPGLLGFNLDLSANFAIGGAETGHNVTAVSGGQDVGQLGPLQVGKFLTNIGTAPGGALAMIEAGGNNYADNQATVLSGSAAAITALVNTVVADTGTAVTQMAQAGAKTIVVVGLGHTGLSPRLIALDGTTPGASAAFESVAAQHNATLLQTLAGLQSSLGVHIIYTDVLALGSDIRAHPAAYGITSFSASCIDNAGTPTGACGNVLVNGTLPSNGIFYWDNTHVTEQVQLIVAQQLAATISAATDAPRGVAAQAQFAFTNMAQQQQTLEDRLTNLRAGLYGDEVGGGQLYTAAADGSDSRSATGLAAGDEPPLFSRFANLTHNISIYANGAYAQGRNAGSATQSGFDFRSYLGSVGLVYTWRPNLILGGEFGYTDGRSELDLGAGDANVHSHLLSLYATYVRGGLFFDGSLGASHDDYYKIERATLFPVLPIANATTTGTTFGAAVNLGYAFAKRGYSIGPIGGFRVTHSHVDGYTETDARFLNLTVGRQNADSAIGSAGLQASSRFTLGGIEFRPVLRLTLEHEFTDTDRTITSSLPDNLANTVTVEGGQRTVGHGAAALNFRLSQRVSALLQYDTTLGSRDSEQIISGRVYVGL